MEKRNARVDVADDDAQANYLDATTHNRAKKGPIGVACCIFSYRLFENLISSRSEQFFKRYV